MRAIAIALAAAVASASFAATDVARADERAKVREGGKGAQVRGYTERRGGYSYSYADTINTYGDSRSVYGAAQSFRDPMLDRQTIAGPFDHGFFFESGVSARGGNSPYLH